MGKSVMDKQNLIQNVCEKCPASSFGQKTKCSLHNIHVGKIESCRQWDNYMAEHQGLRNHDGQLALTDLEPAMEWLQRTEEEIRDYSFMKREIKRLQGYLLDAGEGTVGSYGIDMVMPKGKGTTGDKTLSEVSRRERQWKRLQRLQDTVLRIESAMAALTDEKQIAVLECIIDGVRMNLIARHVGVSRQTFYEIKYRLIIKMAWEMYGKEEHQELT